MPASNNLFIDKPVNSKVPLLHLYIHWPFCEKICPYCDFNVIRYRSVNEQDWCTAYLAELYRLHAEFPDYELNTIYFGGGTPSLIAPKTIGKIINQATNLWPTISNLEITLEANPNDITANIALEYKEVGINRLSLGIQSIRDDGLSFLGRWHNADQSRKAYTAARSVFDNLSLDLIYARPHQTLDAWQQELAEVLSWQPDHLSPYQLTIEPNTAFDRATRRGTLVPVDSDVMADYFELTQDLCNDAGLPIYEVSNHARPGKESRHNMSYWTGKDYAGIGPGAHGRLTVERLSKAQSRIATQAIRSPGEWLAKAKTNGQGCEERTQLSHQDQFEERILMGLRLCTGIPRTDLKLFENNLPNAKIHELMEGGFLVPSTTHLQLTDKGRLVMNVITNEILAIGP